MKPICLHPARCTSSTRKALHPTGRDIVLLSIPASRCYRLNETGTCIWLALVQGGTLGDMASALEADHDVEHDQALTHARVLVRELLREGLILGEKRE